MATNCETRTGLRSLADAVYIAQSVAMPRLGLGTWRARGEDVRREIREGLALGYRLIDTAANYHNEREIGEELATAGVPREELFVTTKLEEPDQGYDSTLRAIEGSLERLQLDYVDLYLIHWPMPRHTNDTWRAMETLLERRRVRAIGVSNFEISDLEQLARTANVPPAVNQYELHPRMQRPELAEYCRNHCIVTQAWGPVLRGHVGDVRELAEIGERYGKTAAQVSIRWILQKGYITIPKSVHRERLAENANVFDFELTAEDMARIDSLDRSMHSWV